MTEVHAQPPMYTIKSRLAIRVLNYCRPRINAKRLNDVTLLALVRSSTT